MAKSLIVEAKEARLFDFAERIGARSMMGKMLYKKGMSLTEIEAALVAAEHRDNPNAYLGGLIAKRSREDG